MDKNPGNSHKYTPIHSASEYGQLAVLKYLIEFVSNIDIRTDEYYENDTPLHRASRFGNLATVRFLVEKGANPKILSKSGYTAYDYAVGNGKIDIAEYLKEYNNHWICVAIF